jgi:hypothetical protein
LSVPPRGGRRIKGPIGMMMERVQAIFLAT